MAGVKALDRKMVHASVRTAATLASPESPMAKHGARATGPDLAVQATQISLNTEAIRIVTEINAKAVSTLYPCLAQIAEI